MVSYRSGPGDIGGYQMLYSRLGPRERMMTELKSVAITIHIGNPSPELKGEWCLQKLAKRGDVRYSMKIEGLAQKDGMPVFFYCFEGNTNISLLELLVKLELVESVI